MKGVSVKLECYLCCEVQEVDEKCDEVICGSCLIAGEPPIGIGIGKKRGIYYYSKEAFSKLLGECKLEPEIWENAQRMRDEGLSTRAIARQLQTSQRSIIRHTESQKVESYA